MISISLQLIEHVRARSIQQTTHVFCARVFVRLCGYMVGYVCDCTHYTRADGKRSQHERAPPLYNTIRNSNSALALLWNRSRGGGGSNKMPKPANVHSQHTVGGCVNSYTHLITCGVSVARHRAGFYGALCLLHTNSELTPCHSQRV